MLLIEDFSVIYFYLQDTMSRNQAYFERFHVCTGSKLTVQTQCFWSLELSSYLSSYTLSQVPLVNNLCIHTLGTCQISIGIHCFGQQQILNILFSCIFVQKNTIFPINSDLVLFFIGIFMSRKKKKNRIFFF